MIKDNPGMIKVHLSAKCHKSLVDMVKIRAATNFMRAYNQGGPWADMLRGCDSHYWLLLYPIPEGVFIENPADIAMAIYHKAINYNIPNGYYARLGNITVI